MTLPTDLKEKACLVTGASRGIGAAVARALGRCGAHVAVHYRTGEGQAAAVARDIEEAGGRAVLLQGNIAERGVAERLVRETAEAFGGLDILINNAGDLIARYRVEETTDEFFDQQVATNIQPVFAACRAAIPLMRQRGSGVIVNVSSVAARTGGGGGSSLYASEGFRRHLHPCAREGIGARAHPCERGLAWCNRHADAGPHHAERAASGRRWSNSAAPDRCPRGVRRDLPLSLLGGVERLRHRPEHRSERRSCDAVTRPSQGQGDLLTVPDRGFYALGAGSNLIPVDPVHDLVVVLRWIQRSALDGRV